jgi:hypothetical protein
LVFRCDLAELCGGIFVVRACALAGGNSFNRKIKNLSGLKNLGGKKFIAYII